MYASLTDSLARASSMGAFFSAGILSPNSFSCFSDWKTRLSALFSFSIRSEVEITANLRDEAVAHYLAVAGFNAALAEAGAVTADTVVFNTVVSPVGELRGGRWEVPARDSWHAQAFPVAGR